MRTGPAFLPFHALFFPIFIASTFGLEIFSTGASFLILSANPIT
jgi:hypothetical protein